MTIEKKLQGKDKIIGTLFPLFSLPHQSNPKKSGTLHDALDFIDWLHRTGQHAWQLLPLHETQLVPGSKIEHVPSPYKGYGIGLDPRFLSAEFANIEPNELDISLFLKRHADWITDYALFCSLRDHFSTDDWTVWDEGIRIRKPDVINIWTKRLEKQIYNYVSDQWRLEEAYKKLHEKAAQYGILLIGDISYYLSVRSPLVWTHQHLFHINADGSIPRVSGVPDEPKSMFGRQLWGHPLYNWNAELSNAEIINLWKIRLTYVHKLFDIVRLDHANGFFLYGSLDPTDEKNDRTIQGPGRKVFEPIIQFCERSGIHIIAEDAGEDLHELRDALKKFSVPGIRVLRCGIDFKSDEIEHEYADLSTYPHNSVAYTTTHDTETLLEFVQMMDQKQKKQLARLTKAELTEDTKSFAQNLRGKVINSPSQMVIIPLQDWLLSLDRINTPGTEKSVGDTNWRYILPFPIKQLPIVTN